MYRAAGQAATAGESGGILARVWFGAKAAADAKTTRARRDHRLQRRDPPFALQAPAGIHPIPAPPAGATMAAQWATCSPQFVW